MAPLTSATLRKHIAAGEIAPLYVLLGADEVEKSEVARLFDDVVEEPLRPFNVDHFYGGDTRASELLDAANTLPMMAPRRIVVLHEAEKLLVPKRESKAADEEQDRLAAFIKSPAPQTTVVFVCGGLDMRRKIAKLLINEAEVVNCGSIDGPADAERWVKARAARDGVTFQPAAVRVLAELAGPDVTRLRAGFDRVVLYAMGQPAITEADVREVVTAGPEAQENFGIANAIGNGDASGALRQLAAALDAGAQPFFVLGQIRSAAERLPASRLRTGIEAVFQTDLALKSSGGEPRILLERLVVELCGTPASAARAPRRR